MADDWGQWNRYVLENIKEIKEDVKALNDKVDALLINFAVFEKEMKIKSGIWGATGSVATIIVILAVIFIRHLITKPS